MEHRYLRLAPVEKMLLNIRDKEVLGAKLVGHCIRTKKEYTKSLSHFGKSKRAPQKLWEIKWMLDKKSIKCNKSRIYFIVLNNEGQRSIVKIGASECKGGIFNTFAFYKSALMGSPSLRSFGIHLLISKKLEQNKQVEIWCKWYDLVKLEKPIVSLFTQDIEYIHPSIKQIERKCLQEFKKSIGNYPKWNFQERGQMFPEEIRDLYKIQVQNRGKKKK